MAHPSGPTRSLPRGFALLSLLAAALGMSQPAAASPLEPFLVPTAIVAVGGDPSFRGTIGYAFTLGEPRVVQQLGFWDHLADGLLSSHTVSLFHGGGTLLTSGVVPAGTAPLLQDGFRWISIAPLLLPAGSYVIGASLEGDPSSFDEVVTDASSISSALGATFGPQQSLLSALVPAGTPIAVDLMPSFEEASVGGYFGPALAPSPLPLLGASAGWGWSRRLRARCRQRDAR